MTKVQMQNSLQLLMRDIVRTVGFSLPLFLQISAENKFHQCLVFSVIVSVYQRHQSMEYKFKVDSC